MSVRPCCPAEVRDAVGFVGALDVAHNGKVVVVCLRCYSEKVRDHCDPDAARIEVKFVSGLRSPNCHACGVAMVPRTF